MGSHLTVVDFRDAELLAKLSEQGASGATSHELADELGMTNGHPAQSVGSRFARMRGFGMVEFDAERRLWTVTEGAARVLEAERRSAIADTIEALPEEELVVAMAAVAARYRHGDYLTANLLRREYRFGTDPRSAAWGRRR